MSINCYLAMTAAEFSSAQTLPPHIAWMACHFSCYGAGISNLPPTLPPNSIVILNDRTPICGHDPDLIADQLTQLATSHSICGFLLDFQRPNSPETLALTKHLLQALPCPVGVSDGYAQEFDCPVFLPPLPVHIPLEKALMPWNGREIWLELAPAEELMTITKDGCSITPCQTTLEPPFFTEENLHCHYTINLDSDRATFTLSRDKSMLYSMLNEAEEFGVTLAIGLFQQLKDE